MSPRARRWRRLGPAALLLLAGFGPDNRASDAVEAGNAFYHARDYAAAAERYAAAAQLAPDIPEIRFNYGNVRVRSRDLDGAIADYAAALAHGDRTLASRAEYNIGVVKYTQALAAMPAQEPALDAAREAIRHLRASLDLAPDQPDARYNLELAYRLQTSLLSRPDPAAEERSPGESGGEQEEAESSSRQSAAAESAVQPDVQPPQNGTQSSEGMTMLAEQLRQMQGAGEPTDMSRAAAEELLSRMRDQAMQAQERRRDRQRMRLRDPRQEKFW